MATRNRRNRGARRTSPIAIDDTPARNRTRRNPPDNSVEPIDVEQLPHVAGSSCIDLTVDDDVVDLTSPNATDNSMVEITGSNLGARRIRRRGNNQENLRGLHGLEELLPMLANELLDPWVPPVLDLPDLIDEIAAPPDSRIEPIPESTGEPAPGSDTTVPDDSWVCPICFDGLSQLRTSSRSRFSTNCGHVFCNICIKNAVQTTHKCPTCRKKLSMKQIHQIFI